MRLAVLYSESKASEWSELATDEYKKKISAFFKFDIKKIKSKKIDRADANIKKESEGELFLKEIEPGDYVCLLDERGKIFKGSVEFSDKVQSILELGKKRVVFLVGGPYGFSDKVVQRSDEKISLSSLTMSHTVARVVLLEQIYRAMTIVKGLPYHNS